MDSYTSPETSRLLAEAGLEQKVGDFVWCACACASFDKSFRIKNSFHVCRVYSTRPGQSMPCLDPSHVRALDLTDVLYEIERCSGPLRREWTINTCDVGYAAHVYGPGQNDCVPLFEEAHPESVVEAAALVLLALLRERKS